MSRLGFCLYGRAAPGNRDGYGSQALFGAAAERLFSLKSRTLQFFCHRITSVAEAADSLPHGQPSAVRVSIAPCPDSEPGLDK